MKSRQGITSGHLLMAIRSCERKLDILLKRSGIDYSEEDAKVVDGTNKLKKALANLPPRISPPGKTKGK